MEIGTKRAAVIASVMIGGAAGCFSFDFGSPPGGNACADEALPANATPETDAQGCAVWTCNPGFNACGAVLPCSTNLLSDPHHCGACDDDCGGGSCTEGSCHLVTVLAEGLVDTSTVAVDAAFVYVGTLAQGIQRVAKTGGALETFTPSVSWVLTAAPLAADAGGVVWVDQGQILTATAPGQTPTVLVPALALGLLMPPLVLDATYVYWMTVDDQAAPDAGSVSGSSTGSVWRVPRGGGPAEVLSPLSGLQVYLDAPLATSLGRTAFADMTSVRVVGPGGGMASTVAGQSPGISAIGADDQAIYWIAGAQPELNFCFNLSGPCPPLPVVPDGIFAVAWSGGGTRTVSSTGGLTGLLAHAGGLWGIGTGLTRVDVASGEHALFAGGGVISGFALDASRVYWVRGGKVLASPP